MNEWREAVNIRFWDVVDQGFQSQGGQAPALLCDAQTVHVYRNAHGAILLLDVTRDDTIAYVRQELERIPCTLHVLVVANFLGWQRPPQFPCTDPQAVQEVLQQLLETPRPEVDPPACVRSLGARVDQREMFDCYCYLAGCGLLPPDVRGIIASYLIWRPPIKVLGANLKDGFGLGLIRQWLALPYGRMKAEALEALKRRVDQAYARQSQSLTDDRDQSFNYSRWASEGLGRDGG